MRWRSRISTRTSSRRGRTVGKGIYEVDILEAALDGQIPENAILSHDLLEGIFARAGLVTDIEVVEEFPSRYDVAVARQHRWTRGDWQLLPWIFGRGRNALGAPRATPLPLIGRWKLLDNLRRSLSAPTALLSMLFAWLQPMPVAAIWTAYILLTIGLPPLTGAIGSIVPRRTDVPLRSHLLALRADFVLGLVQTAFLVTFLSHQAWVMVDAMGRTLFRLFISRRRMLEWVTAAQTNDDALFDRRALGVQIAASAAFAVLVGAFIALAGHHTWLLAAPFAVLWVLSPARRPLGEPAAARRRPCVHRTGRRAEAEAHRTTDVALLRDVRHRAGEHAPARQFSGGPEPGCRPPDIADQYRPVSPVGHGSAGLRLVRNHRHVRPARSDLRDHGQDGALPRPFLQLVRHDRFACPRSEIRFVGR